MHSNYVNRMCQNRCDTSLALLDTPQVSAVPLIVYVQHVASRSHHMNRQDKFFARVSVLLREDILDTQHEKIIWPACCVGNFS
jgi:hypothetical protein